MIRHIVFDMGGVLKDFNPPKLLAARNIRGQDADILMRELFHETEWIALDHGSVSEQQAYESVAERLPDHLKPAAKDLIFNWWKDAFDDKEGMDELIHELKKNGYDIYLLSNASIRQAEYFHRLPGCECFSGRITSAEVHMLKPRADIYRLCLDTFGLKAEECVFIDDSATNVYCAKLEGYEGIVYHDDTGLLKKRMRELGIRI
jgi:putative hydrolase of the HAD superfamily